VEGIEGPPFIVEAPPFIVRQSPNFGYPPGTHGRNGKRVVAIVDHITAGPLKQSLDWLTNPASNASSNWVIARVGDIYRLVPPKDPAWANGIDFEDKEYSDYQSDLSIWWIRECWRDQESPNEISHSIEHEAVVGQALTEPQHQASLWLHRWLCQEDDIIIDDRHIVGHSKIDAVNRALDPGVAIMERLLADLRQ
jgi:N-acetylmuramoyl-L-alanine amidase